MNIVNNPLIKIVGIILIIYFALFHDTKHKENLRNRLSKEKLKDNASYVENTAISAINNLNKVSEYNKNMAATKVVDVVKVKCGDEVIINYVKSGNNLVVTKNDYNLVIDDSLLSKGLIGMKVGEVRNLTIKEKVKNQDVDFVYDVTLVKILLEKNNIKCNENAK